MAFPNQHEALREASERYDRYVRPLEDDHLGEYIAVGADGSFALAQSLGEAVLKARQELTPDSLIYKIGDATVGSWR